MKFCKLNLFFLFVLIVSCNNPKTKIIRQESEKHLDLKTNDFAKQRNDTTKVDFQSFWQIFRTVVIDNDTNEIVQLTNFPFETRGPMDDDPIHRYDKKEFVKYLGLIWIKQLLPKI